MKQHVAMFEDYNTERVITLTKKVNPSVTITIKTMPDGTVTSIDAPQGIRPPNFSVGQRINRGLETWCCTNGYLLNGKDTCAEEKIFGIPRKYAEQDPRLRSFVKR